MKLIQTGDQILIKQNGLGQLVLGLIFFMVGVILLVLGVRPANGSGSPTTLLLVGGLFALIGLLVIIFAKSQKTTLVKGGQCEVRTKRLLGGKTTDQGFPSSSIAKVRLNVYWQQSGGSSSTNNQPQRRSNLSLIMNDQSQLELADAGASNVSINGLNLGAFSKAPLYAEADQLAKFLEIPLEVGDNGQYGLTGGVGLPTAAPVISNVTVPTAPPSSAAPSPSTKPMAETPSEADHESSVTS